MSNQKKVMIVLGLLMTFFVTVAARLVELQVFDHHQWSAKADQVQTREVIQSQPRGRIYDRNGQLLAFDIEATSVALDNYHMSKPEILEGLLESHLGMSQEQARKLIYREGYFTWIKRKIEPEAALALQKAAQDAGAWGFILIPEWKRVYPQGSLASNVIGFAGMDNRGLEGIELQYDDVLRGVEEHREVVRGGGGIQLSAQIVQPGSAGADLHLTLDATIQHIAEKSIQEAVRQRGAKGGFVIVLDPASGEILALASDKTYDLNHFEDSKPIQRNNWMVSLTFEPGSTFKSFSVLAALEAGAVTPEDIINGDQPLTLFGHKIHNSEYKSYGYKTVKDLFKDSVNTAVVRITQKLEPDYFYNFLKRFGFGELTGIDMPGEVPGTFRSAETWQGTDMASISIGQAVSVTGIQLAVAYAALANGGYLKRPKIMGWVGGSKTSSNAQSDKQIVSDRSLAEIRDMMALVVSEGTGVNANVPGFEIAAKSGTGQKAFPGQGYVKGKYTSLFAGFFPASDPKYVIIVVLDQVDTSNGKPYYGGIVAAPVFKEVTLGLIEKYHLIPTSSD